MAQEPAEAVQGLSEEEVYRNWPNVPRDDLFRYLNPIQKKWFAKLESQRQNPIRCTTSKISIYRMLCNGDFASICEQF